MNKLRVAAVQIEHKAGDKAANLDKIEHFAGLAAAAGGTKDIPEAEDLLIGVNLSPRKIKKANCRVK